jgi:uncharacterized membrane protein
VSHDERCSRRSPSVVGYEVQGHRHQAAALAKEGALDRLPHEASLIERTRRSSAGFRSPLANRRKSAAGRETFPNGGSLRLRPRPPPRALVRPAEMARTLRAPMPHFPHPQSTAAIAGHPIHPMLVPFPIVCFTLALITDIAYWRTSNLMWAEFSAWLLLAGIVFGAIAALFGAIDFLASREIRAQRPAWPHAIGNVIVLILAFFNNLVHAGDGWTSVVPWGLTLSALTVLVMLVTGWLGGALVFTHGVGVRDHD